MNTSGGSAAMFIRLEALAAHLERAAKIANAVSRAALEWDVGRATRSHETISVALQSQIAGIDVEIDTPLDENTREGLLQLS